MTDPPGKCNKVLTTADEWRVWCPEPQDPDTPDERPRCTGHKDDQPAEEK